MSNSRGTGAKRPSHVSKGKLAAMIEQATVDCSNESEQVTGLFTCIEENLTVPFDTIVLGQRVVVASVDLDDNDRIVAVCRRGRFRQVLSLLEVPLPDPPPDGAEWIEAYRHWVRHR